ncbi:hypothetical protein [Streptomyces sp. NPDC058657]
MATSSNGEKRTGVPDDPDDPEGQYRLHLTTRNGEITLDLA